MQSLIIDRSYCEKKEKEAFNEGFCRRICILLLLLLLSQIEEAFLHVRTGFRLR